MENDRPGALVDNGPRIREIDFSSFAMRVSADRYRDRDNADRERSAVWMRAWR